MDANLDVKVVSMAWDVATQSEDEIKPKVGADTEPGCDGEWGEESAHDK